MLSLGANLKRWCFLQRKSLGREQNVLLIFPPRLRFYTTRNSIGDRGVEALARALHNNTSVEALSLGGNPVTDEAARSLASLLRSGRSPLKALNLAGVVPHFPRYTHSSYLFGLLFLLECVSAQRLPDTCMYMRAL